MMVYLVAAVGCVAGIVCGLLGVYTQASAIVWPAVALCWVVLCYLWEHHPDGPWWRP